MSTNNQSRGTVLIFGSFREPGVPCGVTSAVNTLTHSPLQQHFELRVVSTLRPEKLDRGIVRRLLFGTRLLLLTLFRILCVRAKLVDVHAVSGRDFLKHAAIVLSARITLCPVLLRIHGGDFDRVYDRSAAPMQWLIRFILRSASVVVLLSESWADVISRIEPRATTHILPNPIACDDYEAMGRQRKDGGRTVLMLGNLCERKGHFDALDAAKRVTEQLPGTVFEFAGAERDLGARAALETRTEELSLQEVAKFLGPVSGEAKAAAFARAALFILPSHTENMPLSIAEAMAAGLPVVATSVGAIPDMIGEGRTGFLIAPRDPEALAERISCLLQDPERRKEMGERAQLAARKACDQNVIAERTEMLYSMLLQGALK